METKKTRERRYDDGIFLIEGLVYDMEHGIFDLNDTKKNKKDCVYYAVW